MEQTEARPCEDCQWFRTQINRAYGDERGKADLEALYGAHLRAKHGDGTRRLRAV
ncbi:hypothetical protein [Streptomyces sp. PU-14G]|uniref:hypothetical protein n=1 Tax=Streptomyces sp. PU-14G TaxID=2800808 RepID=UPI0034DFC924